MKQPLHAGMQVSRQLVGIALMGDLPATVETIKSMGPAFVYPLRAIVAFPVVYHYLGGVRHVFWDKAKYGNQVRHFDPPFFQQPSSCPHVMGGRPALQCKAMLPSVR